MDERSAEKKAFIGCFFPPLGKILACHIATERRKPAMPIGTTWGKVQALLEQ